VQQRRNSSVPELPILALPAGRADRVREAIAGSIDRVMNGSLVAEAFRSAGRAAAPPTEELEPDPDPRHRPMDRRR
jgi:hypothetical protein